MPNWCSCTVEITHKDPEKVKEFKEAFMRKDIANHFLPEPDWMKTPNDKGELPTIKEVGEWKIPYFGMDQDMRFRDWRDKHWGTHKFLFDIEGDGLEMDDIKNEDVKGVYVHFMSAWNPPVELFKHLETLGFEYMMECYEPDLGIDETHMSEYWLPKDQVDPT